MNCCSSKSHCHHFYWEYFLFRTFIVTLGIISQLQLTCNKLFAVILYSLTCSCGKLGLKPQQTQSVFQVPSQVYWTQATKSGLTKTGNSVLHFSLCGRRLGFSSAFTETLKVNERRAGRKDARSRFNIAQEVILGKYRALLTSYYKTLLSGNLFWYLVELCFIFL